MHSAPRVGVLVSSMQPWFFHVLVPLPVPSGLPVLLFTIFLYPVSLQRESEFLCPEVLQDPSHVALSLWGLPPKIKVSYSWRNSSGQFEGGVAQNSQLYSTYHGGSWSRSGHDAIMPAYSQQSGYLRALMPRTGSNLTMLVMNNNMNKQPINSCIWSSLISKCFSLFVPDSSPFVFLLP